MDLTDAQTHAMLQQAREKASKLLKDLLAKRDELQANPPKLPPDQLEQGRAALDAAVASAERMVKALDDAQRIASTDLN